MAVEKLLLIVAKERGWEIQKVEHVRIANIEGDPRVWLYPTDASDPERLEVKRYKSRLEVNASDTLAAWDLALPKNQRRRYDVFADKLHESPVGPAIYFNMSKPLEIIQTGKRERPTKQAAAATQTQTRTPDPAPASEKDAKESQ